MKHLLTIAACSLFTFPFSVALAAPALVPQTGQNTCYSTDGTVINCLGTGQDGELQNVVAWPATRFTDNSTTTPADDTITDNLTGLIWTKNANPAGPNTWQGALDFIKTKNHENYLGHNDWRLPNRNELESMVNKGKADSAEWLNTHGFSNVQSQTISYWSSSTYLWPSTTSSAWIVFMADGLVLQFDKDNYSCVWPVRTGQSPGSIAIAKTGQISCYDSAGTAVGCPATGQDGEQQAGVTWPTPRFTDNGITIPTDKTITDNLTGLIWTKNANIAGAKNWQEALDYIKTMNNSQNIDVSMGHNDWRLPNSNELESIVNKGEGKPADWLETQGFLNLQSLNYWSSSTYASNTVKAWYVDLGQGFVSSASKINFNYLWPVRKGQPVAPAVRDGILFPASGKRVPDISDAQRAMKIASGLIDPTPEDLSHGDLAPLNADLTPRGNDKIDVYDVIAILRKIVGL